MRHVPRREDLPLAPGKAKDVVGLLHTEKRVSRMFTRRIAGYAYGVLGDRRVLRIQTTVAVWVFGILAHCVLPVLRIAYPRVGCVVCVLLRMPSHGVWRT